MGGLVSGIFGLAEGNPTEKEENQLGALGGYETGVGEGDTTAASTFYQDILSGDPSKIATALAPEISSGQAQVEQQALGNAEFGTRSGGSAASTNAAKGQERGNILNLEGGLQTSAASGAAGLGTSLLGQASGNITTQAQLARQQQQAEQNDVAGIANGAAEIASGFTGMGGGAEGGADPYQVLYQAQHPDYSGLSTENPDLSDISIQ